MISSADQTHDGVLVARARHGDATAFELLVRRHFGVVQHIATRILDGDADTAADIAQDTFITAWRRLDEIDTDHAFRAWLYRIATTRALNAVRARRIQTGTDETFLPPSPAPGPLQEALTTELRTALILALDHLTGSQRACWVLRELEDYSYAQIAQITRASPDAVRGRIHRARVSLARELTSWR